MVKGAWLLSLSVATAVLCGSVAKAQEQFPLLDRIADRVVQKYQNSSCPQIAAMRDQPKSQQERNAIQMLRDDPDMRRAFINRVAAPIANKLFECGLIP